ncbi:exopolysaccharide production protein ExoZ [Novosphingobium hassiacum]|uniref:Exopolysaccharide production protein ExoZ n=1 Tax=Novosphingobium hassiacum TaxID=173676 RepID=A0A7W5ZYQ3_9SPHN|nr:acyltransferase [Novosphingobium hassiacum]MBB3860707.1 exopolysaccharide production protein ExoZ [Novosphingobium hassiacum]
MADEQYFRSIHCLRGIAALMVVVYHTFSYGMVADLPRDAAIWMKYGVAIFFVISGFVMVTSTKRRPHAAGDFIRRRLLRVVPLYWFATFFLFAVGLTKSGDEQRLLASLLFLPLASADGTSVAKPVLDVGWTLNLEMAFYLIFALSMALPRRWSVMITVAVLCLVALGSELLSPNAWSSTYLHPRLLDFAGGMLIAWYRVKLPSWCAVIGFGLLAWLGRDPSVPYTLAVTVPALLIVAGMAGAEASLPDPRSRSMQVLNVLGDASYAIYLMHFATFNLLVLPLAGYPAHPLIVIPLTVGFSAIVGVLVHRWIEKPLAQLLKSTLRRTPLAVPV